MKKIYLFFVLSILCFACEQLEYEYPVTMNSPVLSSSSENIILLQTNATKEALNFSWTNGSNYGTNKSISYLLQIDKKGNNFATPHNIDLGKGKLSQAYTTEALNNMLLEKLMLPVNVAAQLEARLKAIIPTDPVKEDISNVISITITPYKFVPVVVGPPYSALWIVGDATPNGWDIGNPNVMVQDKADPFLFHYDEFLKAGEFKIPTGTGNWNGDFYMPLTNNPDISVTTAKLVPGGNPDNKWRITTPGLYKVTLSIRTPAAITIIPFTPYPNLYIVGDATPAGWNIDNPTPMVKDATNAAIFTYTGNLNAGEFKIPLGKGNWNGDYFMPVTNNQGITETAMQFVPGGNPDYKWKITQAGNYKITVNQLKSTIFIQKL